MPVKILILSGLLQVKLQYTKIIEQHATLLASTCMTASPGQIAAQKVKLRVECSR